MRNHPITLLRSRPLVALLVVLTILTLVIAFG